MRRQSLQTFATSTTTHVKETSCAAIEGVPEPHEASDVRADDGGGPRAALDGAEEETAAMVKSCMT